MAEYEKVFDNPYPNGWEDLPSENTPITASALQEHTDAIEHIESYLNDNPITGGTKVNWNQIQASGSKIAEITIDGKKESVYAPEGGGGVDFEVGNELALENDKLSYKANYGTSAEFETFKNRSDVPIGATYRVTDDFVEGGGSEVYDDTERVIGTWFGKPLYRKCFSGTADFLGNSLVDVPHNIANIGYLISARGGLDNGSTDTNSTQYPIPYVNGSPSEALWTFGIWINKTNIRLRSSQERLNRKYWVILEYTKVGE